MEQIERSLTDAGLEESKISKCLFKHIINRLDISDYPIYPCVFLVCEVNIVKRVMDEGRILYIGVTFYEVVNILLGKLFVSFR